MYVQLDGYALKELPNCRGVLGPKMVLPSGRYYALPNLRSSPFETTSPISRYMSSVFI